MPSSLNRWASGLFAVALAVLLAGASARAEDKKDKGKPEALPKKVADALKAKFPGAVIDEWSQDTKDGKVVVDVDFTQGKQKFEAEMLEDGTILEWEKEIDSKSVPKAVRDALDKKYPNATLKGAEEVYAVKGGKDVLTGYEIDIVLADKKEVELLIAPDGKILKEDAEKKDEKKDKK